MSDDPQNPFAASAQPYAPTQPYHVGRQPGRGYVRQIPILAIMTIVQGALLSMMGIACVGYGIFFSFMPEFMPPEDRAKLEAELGPMLQIWAWVGIGVGVLILLIAILHFVAGFRALKYRGRSFTIITWLLGVLASFTCYCAPTSIGLVIWGLIVFFNPATASAFKMVENGIDPKEIENHFH